VDDWRGENAGYTPTFPSAWLKHDAESSTLQAVLVHSGWWDDYNFAAVTLSIDVATGVPLSNQSSK
jgi:hypothetical protein